MKKASNRVVAIFGCTKGEEVCPLMPFGVKNVWQQKGFMHPSFSHAFALLEEAAHVFGRGMSSKSRNHKHSHTFTRFALNTFTPAATPTSNRHIPPVCDPNSKIRDSLESLGCLVSMGCSFIAFWIIRLKVRGHGAETA